MMKGCHKQGSLALAALILALAGGCATATPPSPSTMYISPPITYLRQSQTPESPGIEELMAGDKVDLQFMNADGWCKVRSVRTNSSGWIHKQLLATSPPPPKAAPTLVDRPRSPVMYVALKSLGLRDGPSNTSKIIKELRFNQKVEKLGENPIGWVQVREPVENVIG